MKNSSVIRAFPLKAQSPKAPKPPKGLSAEARSWWREIRDEYDIRDSAGLLLLQTASEQFDRMRLEEAMIAKEGSVVRDRFGQPKQHPAVLNAREARGALLRCLKALNLDLEPIRDRIGRPAGA